MDGEGIGDAYGDGDGAARVSPLYLTLDSFSASIWALTCETFEVLSDCLLRHLNYFVCFAY